MKERERERERERTSHHYHRILRSPLYGKELWRVSPRSKRLLALVCQFHTGLRTNAATAAVDLPFRESAGRAARRPWPANAQRSGQSPIQPFSPSSLPSISPIKHSLFACLTDELRMTRASERRERGRDVPRFPMTGYRAPE